MYAIKCFESFDGNETQNPISVCLATVEFEKYTVICLMC